MLNDGYPPGRFDPVVLSALRSSKMPPSFTSPFQAVDRLLRQEEAQEGPMSMNGTGSVRDGRDERLVRAGYLLVVGTDRLVRAVAAFVSTACRCIVMQAVALLQARPSASRTEG